MHRDQTCIQDVQPVTSMDVFAAAEWLGQLEFSTAHAVSRDRIEWQCTSSGGGSLWGDTALWCLVAEVFGLARGRNIDGRDELIVTVPLESFPAVAALIDKVGNRPEWWPWNRVSEEAEQMAIAAEILDRSVADLEADGDLVDALCLSW